MIDFVNVLSWVILNVFPWRYQYTEELIETSFFFIV